jgi:hypothetical protein
MGKCASWKHTFRTAFAETFSAAFAASRHFSGVSWVGGGWGTGRCWVCGVYWERLRGVSWAGSWMRGREGEDALPIYSARLRHLNTSQGTFFYKIQGPSICGPGCQLLQCASPGILLVRFRIGSSRAKSRPRGTSPRVHTFTTRYRGLPAW